MKKHILFWLLLFVISSHVKGQFTISYSPGYGKYKMEDMQEVLNRVLVEIQYQIPGIPFTIIEDFPGYINHSLDIGYLYKNHEFSIRGSYLTTGGKVSYADYSGEYIGKLTLNGYRIGLNYRFYQPVFNLEQLGKVCLFGEVSPAIIFSQLKTAETIRLFDETESAPNNRITGNGFSFLPQIGVKWFILPFLGVHISGGYDFHFSSNFSIQGRSTNMKADWTGVRLNGGISASF